MITKAASHAGAWPISRSLDVWTAFSWLVASLCVFAAARPIADPDIWWHVRLGELIIDHGIPTRETWAFTAIGRTWTPTSWLSDVAFATAHNLFGWRGLIFLKLVLAGVLLTLVLVLVKRRAAPRLAAPVFVLTAVTLLPFLAERPQLASLILVVFLAELSWKMLHGRTPSWWTVAMIYFWANIHGMWVLAPICLLVASVAVLSDGRDFSRKVAGRGAAIAVLGVASSLITPVGPRLTVAAIAIREAASDVSEWQPTNLLDRYSVFFLFLFLIWVAAVSRFEPVPRSEMVWMIFVFVFSLIAARNIAPAAILVSPHVAHALQRLLEKRLRTMAAAPRVPAAATAACGVAALAVAVSLVIARPPLVDGLPDEILVDLRSREGSIRVLNSYVVGGYLTGLGAPDVSVAIDGRTELFEPAFVHRYFRAATQMVGWRRLLRELDPDAAVIGRGTQLASELRRIGWRVTLTDDSWVLLEPPVRST
jgi:hypothetical protein